jgi:hypothetical protein
MRNGLVTIVILAVGAYFGAKFYVQRKASEDLDAVLTQVRPFVDVEYEQVVATLGGELRVEGLTIRLPQFDDPLTIESVGVLTPGFLFLLGFDRRELAFPERIGFAVTGLEASADADFMRTLDELHEQQVAGLELTAADRCASTYGMTAAALKRLGYHEIVVDFEAHFRTEGTRLVMEVATEIEDMYAFDVELTLEGVPDPTALARGVRPMLVGARVDYFDRSLNSRLVKHCAEEQVTREDVVAAQLREIQKVAGELGIELDAPLIEPYTDFLLGKRRFTLTSAPPRPIDLTSVSLYKPSDVPNLLNLTAEAG